MGGLRRTQCLLIQRIQSSAAPGSGSPPWQPPHCPPERELIKLPYTIPVVLAQRVGKLKGLDQVHRADHHVVVPAAEVVIDIDGKQPARIDAQLRSVGGNSRPYMEWPKSSRMPRLSSPTCCMAIRVRAAFGKMILLRGSRGLYSITNLISG